ncbi:MAG: lactate/malate family dehydrogenase, partial [Actinomycetota bacterium]
MYLTDKKVAIMGAAGAIGSNLVQDLLSTGTANNIAMYDPFAAGLEGAAEEIYHCAYPGARVTWTTDVAEALSGTSYIISSGGAPRKEGMTREDLLRGNCEIA